jgi:DNA-binding MarR family transcriptional regulator
MNHPVRERRRNRIGDACARDTSRSHSVVNSVEPALSEADRRRDTLLASILRTGVRIQTSIDRSFSQHGLTMVDASILLCCVEAPRILTPGKLAIALGRDKGAITHVVDRLEKKCFVRRVAGRHDRRISLLKPTDKAKEIAPTLKALFTAIHRQLFAEITEIDVDRLVQSLARLRKNASVIGQA